MQVGEITARISVEGAAAARASLDQTERSFVGVAGAASKMAQAIGIAGAAAGAYALGRNALDTAARMESLRMALQSTMGGTAGLTEQMKRLEEIAKLPAINLEQTIMGFIQFRSAKLSAQEAEKALIGLAKAAAAVAATPEQFGRATVALQQLANSPKPMQEEINQLRESLPNATALLDKAFGKSRAEDLAELGITGKQAAMGFLEAASQLATTSGGIGNAIVNMEDAFRKLNESIGLVVAKFLDAFGPTIQNMVLNAAAVFEKFSKNAGAVESVMRTLFVILGAAAVGAVIKNVAAMVVAFRELATAMRAMATAGLVAQAVANPGKALAIGAGAIAAGAAFNFGMNKLFSSMTAAPGGAAAGGAGIAPVGIPGAVSATGGAAPQSSLRGVLQASIMALVEAKNQRQQRSLDQIALNTQDTAQALTKSMIGGGQLARLGVTAAEARVANTMAGSGYGVSGNAMTGGNWIERHIRRTVMDEMRRTGGYGIPRG